VGGGGFGHAFYHLLILRRCRGPIPRVLLAAIYDPTNLDTTQSPSGKLLGSQVLRTRTNPGHDLYQYPFRPGSNTHPGARVATLGSLWSWACDLEADILTRHNHYMSAKIRHNHWLPRVHGNMHSRAGNHPVTTWHSDSTMQRTCIRVMMTLTLDRLARRGQGSP
jgi:hypothetical protein